MSNFSENRFPLDIGFGSSGGPERQTDIVTLGSGREERNQRWRRSRRRFEAGYGVKTLDELNAVVALLRSATRPALWLPLSRSRRLEILPATIHTPCHRSGNRNRRWDEPNFRDHKVLW